MHNFGYIHGDIRWPNVAYHDDTQSYLLIDFENVEKNDENCPHPNKFKIDDIKWGECKCFIRDLYFIRNEICDFSLFPRNGKFEKLFKDIRSILEIKKKEEWNEIKKNNLFNLLVLE